MASTSTGTSHAVEHASDSTLPRDFPIANAGAGAKLTLSSLAAPNEQIHILTMNSPPDNRMSKGFITAYMQALDFLEARDEGRLAVLVTTSAIDKFFSNGFELTPEIRNPRFHRDYFQKLLLRLLTFPIPTVAWVNGHAVSYSSDDGVAHQELTWDRALTL